MPTAAASILDGARLLGRHGGPVEVRILKTKRGTVSGYFADLEALAAAVAPWDGQANIYVTLNPVLPDLLARATNRLEEWARATTEDQHVTGRRWFAVDLDPRRPAGISSTDAELEAARQRRDDMLVVLTDTLGFPAAVTALSGNGAHSLWPIELPNDEATTRLIEQALAGLKARFHDAAVSVDQTVGNASRIWKLYGTIACKGDPTPDRPHRRSQLEHVPDPLIALTRAQLERIAAWASQARQRVHGNGSRRGPAFDLVGIFSDRGMYLKPLDNRKHAIRCPWEGEHSIPRVGITETALFEPATEGEPWGFKCHHDHCHGRTIREVIAWLGLNPSANHAPPEPDVTTPPAPREPTWPTLDPAALIGLPGRAVELIAPQSEADPVAILLHFLAAAGNLLGLGPHARVEQDEHPARLNVVLVGKSSKGRKGTSWSTPKAILRAVDPYWAIASGLSSGEGLIYHVRDKIVREDPEGGDPEIIDEGITDKRLLVVETEFASVLSRMERDGNSLSAIMRDAWDHGDLRTLTKNSPLKASGAHISMIGHITAEELSRLFTDVSMANGFGNRILWALVRRSKLLPDGGGLDLARYNAVVDEVRDATVAAASFGRMGRDPEATAIWRDIYDTLSREREGLVGALLGRGEAQTLRLAVLYAALDKSPTVRPPHLAAALAVWSYCEASVLYLFGGRTGDPVADTVLDALRREGRLTLTEVSALFSRHKNATRLRSALRMLERMRLARAGKRETGGRPEEYWEATWTT